MPQTGSKAQSTTTTTATAQVTVSDRARLRVTPLRTQAIRTFSQPTQTTTTMGSQTGSRSSLRRRSLSFPLTPATPRKPPPTILWNHRPLTPSCLVQRARGSLAIVQEADDRHPRGGPSGARETRRSTGHSTSMANDCSRRGTSGCYSPSRHYVRLFVSARYNRAADCSDESKRDRADV